jgi:hypothetical protein
MKIQLCDKMFSRKDHLEEHMRVHSFAQKTNPNYQTKIHCDKKEQNNVSSKHTSKVNESLAHTIKMNESTSTVTSKINEDSTESPNRFQLQASNVKDGTSLSLATTQPNTHLYTNNMSSFLVKLEDAEVNESSTEPPNRFQLNLSNTKQTSTATQPDAQHINTNNMSSFLVKLEDADENEPSHLAGNSATNPKMASPFYQK